VYPDAPANLGQTTPACPPQRGQIEIEQINVLGAGREAPQREIVTVAGTEHRDPSVPRDVSLQQAPGDLPRACPPLCPIAAGTERVASQVRRCGRPPGPAEERRN
jgi:hypothetical protein